MRIIMIRAWDLVNSYAQELNDFRENLQYNCGINGENWDMYFMIKKQLRGIMKRRSLKKIPAALMIRSVNNNMLLAKKFLGIEFNKIQLNPYLREQEQKYVKAKPDTIKHLFTINK